MPMPSSTGTGPGNLLCDLHKWAAQRQQDENFVTEAFAHLLRYLLSKQNPAGTQLLKLLTGGRMDVPPERLQQVSITTQVSTDDGRPDVAIATSDTLLYVEVKVDWDIDAGQLSEQLARYRRSLERESGYQHRYLAVLTRYPLSDSVCPVSADHAVRWFQIARCLETDAAEHLHSDPVGVFLLEQFVSFLASRNIAMRRVGESITDGVIGLRSLLQMVEESLRACDVQLRRSTDWDNIGFYCTHERRAKKFWVGIWLTEPFSLWFQTYDLLVEKGLTERLGLGGQVVEKWWARGQYTWEAAFDLSPANTSFFQGSATEQFEQIKAFLEDCVAKVRRIETAHKNR
jgi:hypothetical protein